jgi:hypothetical protein
MDIPFPLVRSKKRERNNSDDKRDEFQPHSRFPRVFDSFAALTMYGFRNAIPQCLGFFSLTGAVIVEIIHPVLDPKRGTWSSICLDMSSVFQYWIKT